jgi:hypothetical protein
VSSHTNGSAKRHDDEYTYKAASPTGPEHWGNRAAMDDRDEEMELVSLLILREDRRRMIPRNTMTKRGTEAAA